jgi:hypothetical protein
MARKLGGRVSAGLLIEAVACLILAVVFKLDASPPLAAPWPC